MSERGERGRGKRDKERERERERERGGGGEGGRETGGYTDSMQVWPKKHLSLHRCHKGRWTVLNADVHCAGDGERLLRIEE